MHCYSWHYAILFEFFRTAEHPAARGEPCASEGFMSRFHNRNDDRFFGGGLCLASGSGALAQWPQLLDIAEKVPTASAAPVSLPILSARGDSP
jgi:hypothetical protein